MSPAASAGFPTTAWECIREAQDPGQPQPRRDTAVNRMIDAYWRPVFYYLRARGHPAPDAEDLTQEFFVRFVTKGWLDRVEEGKGRFRAFLKTLVGRFAIARTHRGPRQDQFERRFVAVSGLVRDEDRSYEPAAGETPEEVFDREWKAQTLATVRGNLRAYYEAGGDPAAWRRYEVFSAYHLTDRVAEQPTWEELAARFGLTRDAVRYALEEVKKRYERLLRQEVRDQVGSEEELEAELRGLV